MPPSLIMCSYEKSWQAVKARIAAAARKAGRNPNSITLAAVSKTFSPAAVRALHALGQRAFGESYMQEARTKIATLSDVPTIEWHLIGPVQSNKTASVAPLFAWVHTIDRLKIATRLAVARPSSSAPLNVCVQVNISGEASKNGVPPNEALDLASAVARLPGLRLRGFMGIAEATDNIDRQRAQFALVRGVFEVARNHGLAVDTLSMGMSSDLEAAIAEGATMVRIGSAIFGDRPAKPG